jgi:hypothetical protein
MTPKIPLAADLIPLVLSGKKTSTIRLGIRNYSVGPARIVSRDADIGIEITEVELTKVERLSVSTAISEGYNSLDELLMALKRFYPEAGINADVTIVHFRRS